MQILVQALCTKGKSLREAIGTDVRLDRHGLQVTRQLQLGRAPGWLKRSAESLAARNQREHERAAPQYFPKGTDLSAHCASDLAAVALVLDTRPRKTLGWRTPAEALDELLRSDHIDTVATTG